MLQARDRLQSELDTLRERRETAKKQQTLLPIRQPLFIGLIVANLLLLLLVPLSAEWRGGTARARGTRVWRAINESICAACGNEPPSVIHARSRAKL